MTTERLQRAFPHTLHHLHGDHVSDFLSESFFEKNGQLVRNITHHSPQERAVYRGFGKFFKKMRLEHESVENQTPPNSSQS
jgi:hypothetical protein